MNRLNGYFDAHSNGVAQNGYGHPHGRPRAIAAAAPVQPASDAAALTLLIGLLGVVLIGFAVGSAIR